MKRFYIYKIYFNEEPNVVYIGFSHQPKERYWQHLSEAKRPTRKGNWLKDRLARGWVLQQDILASTNGDIAALETAYIRIYRQLGFILKNSTDGGEGARNPSPETRAKRSASLKGNKSKTGQQDSPETRRKKAEAHARNNYVLFSPEGIKHTSTSLNAFGREHGLDCGALTRVVNGKYTNHKGWTGYKVSYH